MRQAALLTDGNGNTLAIDAGTDFRQQMLRAGVDRLDGVLLTHEHMDHTGGLDDLRPYCFRQQLDMPVHCLKRVGEDVRQRFAYAFTDYPGVPRIDLRTVNFGDRLPFGERELQLLRVQHGRLPILGFRVGSLAYLTDVKTLPEETADRLGGLRTLVISMLHDRGTHSHLSLAETVAYHEQLRPQRTVLIHLSHRAGRHVDLSHRLPAGMEVGFDGMVLDVLPA